MHDAVICEPVRTPVGGFGGVFKDVPVTTLASTVVRGLVERTGIASTDVDDVIFGQGYANGEAAAIGRIAALDAGLDVSVPGIQLDRSSPPTRQRSTTSASLPSAVSRTNCPNACPSSAGRPSPSPCQKGKRPGMP